jgi:hypothetical protein
LPGLELKQFGMTARELTNELGMLRFLVGKLALQPRISSANTFNFRLKFLLQPRIGLAKTFNFRLSILGRCLGLLAFLIPGR